MDVTLCRNRLRGVDVHVRVTLRISSTIITSTRSIYTYNYIYYFRASTFVKTRVVSPPSISCRRPFLWYDFFSIFFFLLVLLLMITIKCYNAVVYNRINNIIGGFVVSQILSQYVCVNNALYVSFWSRRFRRGDRSDVTMTFG